MSESTTASPRPAEGAAAAEDTTIRPFRVNVPEEALDDLRRRIAATRWPSKELVADSSQGVQLATMQALARYWATEYDWRQVEARLNALPQFMTEIDGLDIHFIHVKSQHENALPLIITHGWPGSVIELLEVIGPLTDPTAHGGDAEDAFDLVMPSLPGYGFSAEPTEVGWDPGRIGAGLGGADEPPRLHPLRRPGRRPGCRRHRRDGPPGADGLLGVHFNFLDAAPRELLMAALGLRLAFSEEERAEFGQVVGIFKRGYIAEMGEHPQTIGYSLLDSPVGLAAWMLDHDADSYEKISRAFLDGKPSGGLTRDQILDNITLYWLTNTGGLVGAAVLGDRTKLQLPRSSSRPRTSRSRWPSRCSPARSSRPRATGSRRPTTTSSTSTRSTGAATSPPGKSPSCSPKKCARRSGRCASRARWRVTVRAALDPREVSLRRADERPSWQEPFLLPPRPGWRDLAGRYWHARPDSPRRAAP